MLFLATAEQCVEERSKGEAWQGWVVFGCGNALQCSVKLWRSMAVQCNGVAMFRYAPRGQSNRKLNRKNEKESIK